MSAHCAKLHDLELDTRAFRDALGCFATGVAVITTQGDGGAPIGLAVNSFSSVSLDPPLILWSIALSAPSLAAFRNHCSFAVNIMSADAKQETLKFAQPSENKFAGIEWTRGHANVPVLRNALATLECRTEKRIAGGDHEIYLGRVKRFAMREGDPLIFHRGEFTTIREAL